MKLVNLYRPLFAYVVYDDHGTPVASFFDTNEASEFKWQKFGHWGTITITDYLY